MSNQQLKLNYKIDIASMSLVELKQWISGQQHIKGSIIKELKNDSRKTTTKLAERCILKNKKMEKEQDRIESIKEIEGNLHKKGYKYIAGVDEAGKGSLAGPVTAAAVIFPEDVNWLEVNDSKKLTTEKRENLYSKIINQALAVGIGMVSVDEINEIGISMANRLAMKKAVNNLYFEPDFVLIDCIEVDLKYPSNSIVQGDSRCFCIAAASIIAKVTRDRKMIKLSGEYPEYGLEDNKGYGTSMHQKAVKKHGYCEVHRKNFNFNTVKSYQKLNF